MRKPEVLFALELDPAQKDAVRDRLARTSSLSFFDELSADAFAALAPKVEVLVRYGFYRPFPDEVFQRMSSLRLIQVMAAGAEFLEGNPAIPEGVRIQGARGANSAAVAEQAMALLLAVAKHLLDQDRTLRHGLFDQRDTTRCLAESVVGILGLGSIGAEIAKRCLAFGMEVLAIDERPATDLPVSFLGASSALERVLKACDFLVLSLPLTPATRGIIDARALGLMKPDAALVNVGRGPLIDEQALYEHLRAHPRFRAGLDVWWKYPTFSSELVTSYWGYPYSYPFHLLDNVVMTPHMASYSGLARQRMLAVVLAKLGEYLEEAAGKGR